MRALFFFFLLTGWAIAQSPSGTLISPAVQIVDGSGNVWTLPKNGVVMENGVAAGYTSKVAELAYVSGVIWQENSAGAWWYWNGTAWASGSSPFAKPTPTPTPTPIMIGQTSVLTIADGSNANLVVCQSAALSQTASITS